MVLTIACVSVCLVAQSPSPIDLRWRPSSGDKHVYELFVQSSEFSAEASLEHVVVNVGKDGSYSVRSRSLGALVRIAGNEMRDERPNESTASFDVLGRLQDLKGGSVGPEKFRNALLTSFVCPESPVSLGQRWIYARDANKSQGLSACSIEYTLSKSSDKAAEVKFQLADQGGEYPQKANGTWWLERTTKSGWIPVRFEAKVTNFVGQKSSETEVKLSLRRPS